MFDDLKALAAGIGDRRIESLFDHAGRAQEFSLAAEGMLFDYSKTQIDAQVRAALLALAERRGVAAYRDAMFSGEKINETEGRAVLHTALRNLDGSEVRVDGQDVMPPVLETLTLVVSPVRRLWTKTSTRSFVSPGARLSAAEAKATDSPSPLMHASRHARLLWVPAALTLTRSVVWASRSRTNTSYFPLVSPVTRLVAHEQKATYRPSALIEGVSDAPSACEPPVATLTRSVVPVRRSRTKMSP